MIEGWVDPGSEVCHLLNGITNEINYGIVWGIKGLTIGNGIWGDGNYVYTVGYTSPDYYYNEDSYLCLIKWDSNGKSNLE